MWVRLVIRPLNHVRARPCRCSETEANSAMRGCIIDSACHLLSAASIQNLEERVLTFVCRMPTTLQCCCQADEERDSIHTLDHDAEDRRLATAAAFTMEQRTALCALRERLLVNLGRLQRRREVITAELQVCELCTPCEGV